ncbi:RelA/SpoT domain-containing protein [Conexibacter sp. JD483]|uniref:GTP pyrophosphokinase n=1 Tax=unclassified Conexibacter TaxID=2627773 RepID=UPI002725A1A1|nr:MULTISPECIES: RelA/SpoT domain-containing protein [unclassified Conexibacter]MDO8184658.1 RelA/SpoT domain-containing protein [Conexibacter sp. CPCC 205706]MDO8197964.1 RelA/SpoT domain-containing protein [Conexibacter sp. CPCC 205762]MDR9368394.1 RelA/SpoT domain-containing protein [Conexibacter sp. JD483]
MSDPGTDSPYAQLRDQYAERYPRNEQLAEHISAAIDRELTRLSVYATVSHRAKDPDSFATKAMLGGYEDPLERIGDQVGVRVTVPYLADVDRVEQVVRGLFEVIRVEDKLDALGFDRVGYLGRHVDLRLPAPDARALGDRFVGLKAELQIRTTAQSAWADVTHDQLYKPAAEAPPELRRRIFRLVALVELFDQEVAAFANEVGSTPGFAEAVALKPLADALLRDFDDRRKPNRQLSSTMAAALVPLYGQPADAIYESVLKAFVVEHGDRFRRILSEAVDEGDPNPLLHQPEIFVLLERLTNDRLRVQTAWPQEVPEEWLHDAADRWDIRLPDA